MTNTRGNLVPAQIYEVDENREEVLGGISVSCMFNPFEYSVSKSNTYQEKPKNQANIPQGEFFKAGAQTLRLVLVFDTYEAKEDVSRTTSQLWDFMATKSQTPAKQNEKVTPPMVAFEWGVFRFVAYITSMTQKFTLFDSTGTPVRANVDITFTQYTDFKDYSYQNPSSGGGAIETIWRVVAGDRLDTIAAEAYNDATKWRLIAERNHIINPLVLKPGQHLSIPFE
jgi:hypothetical protein